MWADNGDELSRIYTGTGALKSGFTRTGKRTLAGFMDDARKTAQRLYINNFQDKSKQEVIDLLLGKLANQITVRLHNPIREAVMQSLNARYRVDCGE
jgi:adenine-specific DNA methylase